MRTIHVSLTVICVLAGLTATQGQEPGAPAQGRIPVEQRFKQWDRNGDGKLTADEVPGPQLFKMLDKNNDGVVTQEEAFAVGRGRAGQTQARRPVRAPGPVAVQLPPAEGFKPRPHGDEAQAAGLKPDVLAKIDIEMQRHIAAQDVAGIIGLISKGGKIGYYEAFGMQDREAHKPMQKDAIFRLQSMTKPVIAACALTLYDEGRFTLDEPIAKHCPEWARPKVLEDGQLVPAKFAITPRMLMSHSSGLYYGTLEGGPFSGDSVRRDAGTTLESFSKDLARKPLKFQPGTGYQYGHSIDVLGRYIEAVAGKPLDKVLKEQILAPLKMADTDFWVPPEKAARICQIYKQPQPGVLERGREAAKLTEKPTLFLGGQGLCSTTDDYVRFCRMLLGGGELDGVRVLKAETVDLMFQNHLQGIGQKYGLGGAVDGEGSYSWGGANGTQFWVDRRNNLFAVFMVQTQLYRSPAYGDFKRLVGQALNTQTGESQ